MTRRPPTSRAEEPPSSIDVAATTVDRPPILDDRALLGHPRGLGLLFLTEM